MPGTSSAVFGHSAVSPAQVVVPPNALTLSVECGLVPVTHALKS
jgi:hypothetical protein